MNEAVAGAFEDGPAFVPYLVAGDPDYESSLAYVEALERGGADLIELGLPFSEPIAEGTTIQDAIVRSLEGGMTVDRYFEFVEDLDVDVPVVCMTYYNLVYQYGASEAGTASEDASGGAASERGPEPFVRRAKEAGISGFVVPDLPAEEAGPLREACTEQGLDLVFVVAPTTSDERLDRLASLSSGYLYVQARLGVTGARADVTEATGASLERLADYDLPKAVGFGIATGEHAREVVAAGADGVIVGSALVDVVEDSVAERGEATDRASGGTASHQAERGEADDPVEATASRLERIARELKEGAVAGAAQRQPGPERT